MATRRRVRFAVLAGLTFAALCTAQPAGVKAVATVSQLMQALIVPASNALFSVARQAPDSDAGWAEVRNSAVMLAESGNLLLIGSRAEASDTWSATSRALIEAGATALKAAEARDPEGVGEAGNQIIDACERCHEKHWIR